MFVLARTSWIFGKLSVTSGSRYLQLGVEDGRIRVIGVGMTSCCHDFV